MSDYISHLTQKLRLQPIPAKQIIPKNGNPAKLLASPEATDRSLKVNNIQPTDFRLVFHKRFAESKQKSPTTNSPGAKDTTDDTDDTITQWVFSTPLSPPSTPIQPAHQPDRHYNGIDDALTAIETTYQTAISDLNAAIATLMRTTQIQDAHIRALQAVARNQEHRNAQLQRELADRDANLAALQLLHQQQTDEHRRLADASERGAARLMDAARRVAQMQVRFHAQRRAAEEVEGELEASRRREEALDGTLERLLGAAERFVAGFGGGAGPARGGAQGEN